MGHKFIGFWALAGPKPYKFIRFWFGGLVGHPRRREEEEDLPAEARDTTGAKTGYEGDAAPVAPPSPHMRSDKGNTCGGAGNQTGPREDSARNQVALQPPLPLLDYDLRPTWRRSGKGPVWRRMFPCRCMAGSAACRNFALPYCGFLCRESNLQLTR